MKLIKLAFFSFILLFLLVTGISLMIPSHVRISKALQVNAPKDSIMAQLQDPAKWKAWFPGMDTVELFYENGKATGVVLNKKTNRYLKIDAIKDTAVETQYYGIKQKQVLAGWNIIPEATPGMVTVQWYMDFRLRWYPWEKFSSLLFEKQYGPQMEQGLNRLKKLLEK